MFRFSLPNGSETSEKVLSRVLPTFLYICLPVSFLGQSCMSCWHVSPIHLRCAENDPSCILKAAQHRAIPEALQWNPDGPRRAKMDPQRAPWAASRMEGNIIGKFRDIYTKWRWLSKAPWWTNTWELRHLLSRWYRYLGWRLDLNCPESGLRFVRAVNQLQ